MLAAWLWWRRRSRSSRRFSWWRARPCCSNGACSHAYTNTAPSGAPARNSAGFFLLWLAPLIFLGAAFLLGSVRTAMLAQARNALQGRLDVCAVGIAVGREKALSRIVPANTAVHASALAIYAERLAAIFDPAAAQEDEELLAANRALSHTEDGLVTAEAALEIKRLPCPATPFSREPVVCVVTPLLGAALERKRALTPDVTERFVQRTKSETLARVRCQGPHGLATVLRVRGNPELNEDDFHDAYEE